MPFCAISCRYGYRHYPVFASLVWNLAAITSKKTCAKLCPNLHLCQGCVWPEFCAKGVSGIPARMSGREAFLPPTNAADRILARTAGIPARHVERSTFGKQSSFFRPARESKGPNLSLGPVAFFTDTPMHRSRISGAVIHRRQHTDRGPALLIGDLALSVLAGVAIFISA